MSTTASAAMIALYQLDGPYRPPVTVTLTVGEIARMATMAHYGRLTDGGCSATLAGKDANGQPLSGHRHAFYLPQDDDGDGLIDHLVIYSPCGFAAAERQALAAITELRLPSRLPRGRTLLTTPLSLSFRAIARADLDGLSQAIPSMATAQEWVSATPYVMTRHPKITHRGTPKLTADGLQRDGVEDQLRREWEQRREVQPLLPELLSVIRASDPHLRDQTVSFGDFKIRRQSGGGVSVPWTAALHLTFAQPVQGPIALGYGCHFGLGQFRPLVETTTGVTG